MMMTTTTTSTITRTPNEITAGSGNDCCGVGKVVLAVVIVVEAVWVITVLGNIVSTDDGVIVVSTDGVIVVSPVESLGKHNYTKSTLKKFKISLGIYELCM